MQGKIADMYTKISATRAYIYAVGRGGSLPFPLLESVGLMLILGAPACDAGQVSRRVSRLSTLSCRAFHLRRSSHLRTVLAQSSTPVIAVSKSHLVRFPAPGVTRPLSPLTRVSMPTRGDANAGR